MLFCALAAAGPALAQPVPEDSGYGRVMKDYAAAMADYRALAKDGASPGAGRFLVPAREGRWTWSAPGGETVKRLDTGAYRIALSPPGHNWFSEIECTVRIWPDLVCSDGRARRMSAPSATRIVFDGKQFDLVRAAAP